MELLSDDSKIIDLLSKLKKSDGAYPPDILSARRQNYVKQVANIGQGMGKGIKNVKKGGNSTAIVTSKILETVLIAAIAIEAGMAVYIYHDKIADVFKTYTDPSNVQEIAPPSEKTSSPSSELIEAPETQLAIATIISPSNTPTITGTPSPEVTGDKINSDANTNINSTPNPNGNNGNHYGQTPKPERTKDNNNGDNGNNNGGNDNGGGNGNNNGGNKNKP